MTDAEEFYCPFADSFSLVPLGVAFVLSIVVLIVLVKTKLLTRKNPLYRILTALYFIYIPVSFLCAGFFFGTVNFMKAEMYNAVDEYQIEINEATLTGITPLLEQIAKQKQDGRQLSAKDVAIELSRRLAEEYIVPELEGTAFSFDEWLESNDGKNMLASLIADELAPTFEKILLKKAAETAQLDQQALFIFWGDSISKSVEAGFVTFSLHALVDQLGKKMFNALVVPALLFCGAPFVEILLYTFFQRKRKKEQPAT